MAQAMTALAIFITVVVAGMAFLSKRTRERAQEILQDDAAPKVSGRSKRQQQLLASLSPPPTIPTIEELVAEEAAATGVNDIPGGEGLEVSLKLRVYWRDEVVRRGCEDGQLEYRIEDGIDRDTADTDEVRLVCIRRDGAAEVPSDEPAVGVEDGDEPDDLADVDN